MASRNVSLNQKFVWRNSMLGAIVGDIVGSVYEWNNIKTKDFPLFREDFFFTDDTVSPNR